MFNVKLFIRIEINILMIINHLAVWNKYLVRFKKIKSPQLTFFFLVFTSCLCLKKSIGSILIFELCILIIINILCRGWSLRVFQLFIYLHGDDEKYNHKLFQVTKIHKFISKPVQ